MALSMNLFEFDSVFREFPHACCGEACDLLSQYLIDNGINTFYVCGTYRNDKSEDDGQTHAWLETSDRIILDITGDQFKNNKNFLNYSKAIYVGGLDEFHKLFDVEDIDVDVSTGIYSWDGLSVERQWKLYNIIIQHL